MGKGFLKDKFNAVAGFMDRRLPAGIPRDKWTKRLVLAATFAYVADCWDPLPIGETIAATCLSFACLRGAYLSRKQRLQDEKNPPPEAGPETGQP